MSNSLLTTVTWTASYATSANTWSAKTTISSGTFTVTGTLANYTTQIVVPAAATTGIEILFTVGAQTSGTWVIGNAQFEPSTTVATSFDYRPYGTELALCQRYYQKLIAQTTNTDIGTGFCATTTQYRTYLMYPVVMRTNPTALEQSGTVADYLVSIAGATVTSNAVPAFLSASTQNIAVLFTVASGLTAGQGGAARFANTNSYLAWSAEL
jgi:hypothetical protein